MKKIPLTKNQYTNIHIWLTTHYGKANKCIKCWIEDYIYERALIKGKKHEKNINNYMELCKKCHSLYDRPDIKFLYKLRNKECMQRIQEAKYKPINQYSLSGGFIKKWKSATHVMYALNISRTAIANNLKGLSKKAGGYIWEKCG